MTRLPFTIDHVGTPPIKCQGIKTKLVPFIFRSIKWSDEANGRWIEPFLGSGVVAFNLHPRRAILSDSNRHIIELYTSIQSGQLNCGNTRDFLEFEGRKLQAGGAEYYYEVRNRFNEFGSSFDFLFLNRSCFNGVMRFNRHGHFNVPFGHKPERFSKSYITKIVNQIGWVAKQMRGRDWEFRVDQWDTTLRAAEPGDFVYLDPPYIGRHTDYYNGWNQAEASGLAHTALSLPCGYALSMWLENRYRKNTHIAEFWPGAEIRVCSHFYHVGSTEELRNEMDEALAIMPGYATDDEGKQCTRQKVAADTQLALAMERRASYEITTSP